MGNDGGSIPTRRELVKSPARQPTHSQLRDSTAKACEYHWTICPLSKRPLSTPIVSDSLGRLYNKDSILEWLLRRTEAFGDGEETLGGRVKSLKDVVELKLEVVLEHSNGKSEQWVCPMTRKELRPGIKAVYLVPCGHVFSEGTIREVGDSQSGCLLCNTAYQPRDVVLINPTEPHEIHKLVTRQNELAQKKLSHALKKCTDGNLKKRKKGAPLERVVTRLHHRGGGIKNPATATLTSKVLEDDKLNSKRRRMYMSENVKSLFSDSDRGSIKVGKNDGFISQGNL